MSSLRTSVLLAVLLSAPTTGLAENDCTITSAHGSAAVAIGVKRAVIDVRDAAIVAQVGAAKRGAIPVEVTGALRFKGDALGLPMVLEAGSETADGVTRFKSGAALEIVSATRAADATTWQFDLRFRGDPSQSIVRGASFDCHELKLAAGPTKRQLDDWQMSSIGLPARKDGTRWIPRAKILHLGSVGMPGSGVTIEAAAPSELVLTRVRSEGRRMLVGRELAPGAYVVGWADAGELVKYEPPKVAPDDGDHNGVEGGVESGEEGGVVGGTIGGVPPPPPMPVQVTLDLPEGAPVRESRGGTAWGTIARAGKYRALRMTDGALVLVAIPGIRSNGNIVFFVDAPTAKR